MGGCYSKRAGHLGDAYSYPARTGSPARPRKRSAMNRTAPYSRQGAAAAGRPSAGGPPPHSFGFRRRPVGTTDRGGGGGGRRVQPVPPPAARRAAGSGSGSGSGSSLASSAGSDANGNPAPGRRLLPRPLVARVKPRTSAAGTGNVANSTVSVNSTHSTQSLNSASLSHRAHPTQSARPAKAAGRPTSPRPGHAPPALAMDDSGVGTLPGSLSSSDSSRAAESLQRATNSQSSDGGKPQEADSGSEPGDVGDLQVGIRTKDATIALSVNIHKGANAALRRPQVTVHDTGGRARVTQVQRHGFGYTQPAGLTRPVGGGDAGHSGSSGVPRGAVTAGRGAAAAGTSADEVPRGVVNSGRAAVAAGSVRAQAARPAALEQTVRSRVTSWEERVDRVRRESCGATPAGRRHERAPTATLTGTPPSLAGLRREMRQLTRDVATSPLRAPPRRDTGTCTETRHVPRAGHVAARHVEGGPHGGGQSDPAESPPGETLSPLGSGDSPESRAGAEDFIDDEIGDQPAFGAFGPASLSPGAFGSDSLSPGAFLDDVLGAGLSDPASPPLPPLQITEALRDDYVRPFRLTPRPVSALTTLETPLRRWADGPATSASEDRRQMAGASTAAGASASERRRLMEERAERLARRLGVGDDGTPLSSTYQRLGLPEPPAPEAPAGVARGQKTAVSTPTPHSEPDASPFTPDRASYIPPPAASKEPPTISPVTASPGFTSVTAITALATATAPAVLLKTRTSEHVAPDATEQTDRNLSAKATDPTADPAQLSAPAPAQLPAPAPAPTAEPESPPAAAPSTSVAETENTGTEEAGSEAPGTEARGTEALGTEARGTEALGTEAPGTEARGTVAPARPRLVSEDVGGPEDSLSDLEARDEVPPGCRPRRFSWRRVSELREMTSPTDSLASDDLMADFDKDSDDAIGDDDSLTGASSRLQRMRLRGSVGSDAGRPSPDPTSKLLRPPRQNSAQDAEDWLLIDRDTYLYMAQDFTHVKTMLHKLRRLLQEAETTNPFENSIQAGRRATSVSGESPGSPIDGSSGGDGGADLAAENAELRRQVSALQRQLTDQSRTIRLLQQQMASSPGRPTGGSSVAVQTSQDVTEDPSVITAAPERA